MCFRNLFRRNPTIPHPEEPFNPDATVENVIVDHAIFDWLIDYSVPPQEHDYWYNQIIIHVDPDYEYPAGVWDGEDGKRHMRIQPGYLNSGVIAHEQAHNSYALLTEGQKAAFNHKYMTLKETDRLISYLFTINTYGLTNAIEGHAEIYRYLHGKIPVELEVFYPRLF